MNKDALYNKVMHILDEVELSNNDFIGNNVELFERFEALLAGTLRDILNIAPLSYLEDVDIPGGEPAIHQDGSGEMKLPENFLRLAAFKMNSWNRTVYNAINETSPLYNVQFSPATRGGVNKPVVAVLPGKILKFWSVPPFVRKHVCERKEYIPNADYYITVQLLAGEGFSISEIPQELKNIATDDEVAAQTEVETFELPQFHGAKLEGNCDEDRCVYSYLIAKDGSCGFYVSVIYKSQEEPVAEKILSSFRMEDN